MNERKNYLIKRNEDGEITYLNKIEIGQFGYHLGFRYELSMAILFPTYYEAAAVMCFIISQLDCDMAYELSITEL